MCSPVLLCGNVIRLAAEQGYVWSLAFDRLRRRAVDYCVGLWAKGAMLSLLYWPKLIGKENLPPSQVLSLIFLSSLRLRFSTVLSLRPCMVSSHDNVSLQALFRLLTLELTSNLIFLVSSPADA